jgi:hypothetical protein
VERAASIFRVEEKSEQATRTKQHTLLAPSCLCIASLGFSLILKMEAVRAFETSVKFYHTTRRFIPEESNF